MTRKRNKEYDDRVTEFLGMTDAAARFRLSRLVMFKLAGELGKLVCFQCDDPIQTVEEFSIEHKIPYLWVDVNLYWDLDNVAFSHLLCNIKRIRNRRPMEHGVTRYGRKGGGCRCQICTKAASEYTKRQRAIKSSKPVPSHIKHGLSTYTTYRCRCSVCHDAMSTYEKGRRERAKATKMP